MFSMETTLESKLLGKEHGPWSQTELVWITVLLFPTYVTFDKSLSLMVIHPLRNGSNSSYVASHSFSLDGIASLP